MGARGNECRGRWVHGDMGAQGGAGRRSPMQWVPWVLSQKPGWHRQV